MIRYDSPPFILSESVRPRPPFFSPLRNRQQRRGSRTPWERRGRQD